MSVLDVAVIGAGPAGLAAATVCAEHGLSVDTEAFKGLMAEQRQRAKADAQARKTGHADLSSTQLREVSP